MTRTAGTDTGGQTEAATGPVELRERELQVLTGMSYGKTNSQIGRQIDITEDTVKQHARRLFRTLGARDRAHDVRIGMEMGLLPGYTPQPVHTGSLIPSTPRAYSDRHIAACFAAESCPCRTGATWRWLNSAEGESGEPR